MHTAIDCNDPPSIPNGSPGTPTKTTFGGTVTYSCNSGYQLLGVSTLSCSANGTWSVSPPICTGRLSYYCHLFITG